MPLVVNLIPMAGLGKRFLDAGYVTPKPLLPIGDVPMVLKAAQSLPAADKYFFICLEDILQKTDIQKQIGHVLKNVEFISTAAVTRGQACTCLLANVEDDSVLTIGACDYTMLYNEDGFQEILNDDSIDIIVWAFRKNPAVLQDPAMYSWVKIDNDRVVNISCKKPLSKDPFNDYALIGTFTFKKASIFRECASWMMDANRTINNEFYIDEAINVAIEKGFRVKVFEVDSYICWGTPRDYETYYYWRHYFQKAGF